MRSFQSHVRSLQSNLLEHPNSTSTVLRDTLDVCLDVLCDLLFANSHTASTNHRTIHSDDDGERAVTSPSFVRAPVHLKPASFLLSTRALSMGSSWGRHIGPALYCRVQLLLASSTPSSPSSSSNTTSSASNARGTNTDNATAIDTFHYDDDRDVIIHPRHRLFQRIHRLLAHLLGPCEEALVSASEEVSKEMRNVQRQLQQLRRNARLFGRKQRSLRLQHDQENTNDHRINTNSSRPAAIVKQRSTQLEEQLALQHTLQQQEDARLVSYLQHLHLLHEDLRLLTTSLLLLQQYYTSFVHSFVHACGLSLYNASASTPGTRIGSHAHLHAGQTHQQKAAQHYTNPHHNPHYGPDHSRSPTTGHLPAKHHPGKNNSNGGISSRDKGDQLRIAQYRLALYNEVRRCKHQPLAYTPTFTPPSYPEHRYPLRDDAEIYAAAYDEDAYDHDEALLVEGRDEEVAIDGGIVLQFWQRLQARRREREGSRDREEVGIIIGSASLR